MHWCCSVQRRRRCHVLRRHNVDTRACGAGSGRYREGCCRACLLRRLLSLQTVLEMLGVAEPHSRAGACCRMARKAGLIDSMQVVCGSTWWSVALWLCTLSYRAASQVQCAVSMHSFWLAMGVVQNSYTVRKLRLFHARYVLPAPTSESLSLSACLEDCESGDDTEHQVGMPP